LKSCDAGRLRLSRHGFEMVLCESRVGHVLRGSARIHPQKHNRNWYMRLVDFYVPNTIQPQDASRGGGTDGRVYESGLCFARSTSIGTTTAGTRTPMPWTTTGGTTTIASSLVTTVVLPPFLREFCFQCPSSNHKAFCRLLRVWRVG
jgi:hypothetical protein